MNSMSVSRAPRMSSLMLCNSRFKIQDAGRFPIDQKFRDFRSETEWNGKIP